MPPGYTETPEASAPASLSRYRSRGRRQQQTPAAQPDSVAHVPAESQSPAHTTTPTGTIPSRYRHRSASVASATNGSSGNLPSDHPSAAADDADQIPPVPPLPLSPRSTNPQVGLGLSLARSLDHIPGRNNTIARKDDPFASHNQIDAVLESPTMRPRDSGKAFRPERGDDPSFRQHAMAENRPTTRWVDQPTHFGGSQPDFRRQQIQDEHLASPKAKTRSPLFGFLSRNRKSKDERNASSTASLPMTPVPASPQVSRADMAPKHIEVGGRGIVPLIDAPTNASNAGERRVVVRFMNSSITLPIKTDSNPLNVLHSAANLITHKLNPETSTVVESYLQYGLERPLRRYELIRDVMNSWDRDSLNALTVVTGTLPGHHARASALDASSVPRTFDPPYSFTLQLYHCPRVGKWAKRIVTLLPTGQVYASKKPGVQLSDKDAVSLCHMSDFDIYSPTEHQIKKVLKPPKKFCYAVKSQQKSNVFPTGENFVHFFCTDDAQAARTLYENVHGWRSWYLVNRKTETQEAVKEAPPQTSAGLVRYASTRSNKGAGAGAGGHRPRQSMDATPYAIGSFKPLMDMDVFTKSYDEQAPPQDHESPPHKGSRPTERIQRNRLSKGSVRGHNRRISTHSTHSAISPQDEVDFAANGLLGAAYEERKEEYRRKEETMRYRKSLDGPFTEGPSLIQNIPAQLASTPERYPSSRYRGGAADVSRQRSTRRASSPSSSIRTTRTTGTTHRNRQVYPPEGMPKPLLDFEEPKKVSEQSASWREAARKGNAVRPPAGAPLVDFATGRDEYGVRGRTGSGSTRTSEDRYNGGRGGGVHGETLLGALARSQSTSSRYKTRRTDEIVPPLPGQAGTLLARMEAQRDRAGRERSGTMR